MHILSPETDNCTSGITGRERMTIENISWLMSTKECCWLRRGSNPRPPGLQSDVSNNPVNTQRCNDIVWTSLRRHDVAAMSKRCHYDIMYLLGYHVETTLLRRCVFAENTCFSLPSWTKALVGLILLQFIRFCFSSWTRVGAANSVTRSSRLR